jgi:hypothetical protein
MPGRLQVEGFEDCPTILISHNHQGTPVADRQVTYTKSNPASQLRIYAEGGIRGQWQIWADLAPQNYNSGALHDGRYQFGVDDYWDYGVTDGQFSRIDVESDPDNNFEATRIYFMYPSWGIEDRVGRIIYSNISSEFIPSLSSDNGRVTGILIFDFNGNHHYPIATPLGEYRIAVEELIDGKVVHRATVQAFGGPIEPLTAECEATNDCEEDCIPYDLNGALLCICKDDANKPNDVDDYNPQPYAHNQKQNRFNDLDL